MVRKSLERLPLRVGPSKKPLRVGSLILLRCGESASYADQIFTGWDDPDLTRKGIEQSQRAGQLLVMHGLDEMVDVVYASVLKRSVKSAFVVLQTTNSAFVPVKKRWRLNQRHYGAAQGLSKREAASQLGETVVRSWRNTLKAKPPPLSELDPSHPRHDRRYREVLNEKESNSLPSSESLLDCQRRATVVWDDEIRELIFRGKTVLVVAHRDTLLGIMRALDDLTESDLRSVRIPRGVPILYRFEASARARGGEYDLVPKPASAHGKQEAVQLVNRTSAVYLEQPKQLHVELQRDLEWTNLRFLATTGEDENKGANDSSLREREGEVSAPNARLRNQTLVSRVQQLRAESNLLHTSNEISSEEAASPSVVDESVEATSARPAEETSGPWASVRWTDDPSEFEDYDEFNDLDDTEDGGASSLSEVLASSTLPSSADSRVAPVVLPVPDSASSPSSSWPHDHAYIVLIRHGRTPHNNLGLFTGWEDPPLAPDGIEVSIRCVVCSIQWAE
jgi:2,3-bisphosphoglycerate-dependent phosphoglycerate mutase